jgi:filamentous hemagglutinin family protein
MAKISNFFQSRFRGSQIESFLFLSFAVYLLGAIASTASAQIPIVPDRSLRQNSKVTPNGDIIEITEGTQEGSNLFHSFEQFSLPTGKIAFFNNDALTVENIISRVTGGSISNIDGLIRANGNANLFLINPNGIIFGSNASLNIGGSFIAGTANSIRFADGKEFSATNPQTTSLLTVSVPIGLQYGSNAGDIVVKGPGNNLSIDFETFAIARENRPVGLQVRSGQTLALVGGNVVLEGGNLTSEGGRIELGSVNGEGRVTLVPTNPGWRLSYENVANFKDINLSQAASLDTSGNGGGNIQVQGRRITLTDGSAILSDTLGNATGGNLTVRASESVEVIGTATNNPFYSGLFADVAPEATGNGGNLTLDTERLLVADGAQISSGTFSSGNAGTLNVKAQNIELIGGTPLGSSGLFAPVAPIATGNGGNLTIETERLLVSDGAWIMASTFGFGNAGNLTVKATEVEVSGFNPGGPSSLLAEVGAGATGNGGNLTVETGRLLVSDSAQLSTATVGSGNAGELTVRATEVELVGANELGRSGLFASAIFGTGNGSEVKVESDRLTIKEGATINASNFPSTNPNIPPGQGAVGNINIKARSILLDNQGILTTEALTGDKGNIILQSQNIQLLRGSTITTNARENASGGNIVINTNNLIATGNSTITANASGSGSAGNIQIQASDVELEQGKIAATGNQGNLILQSQDIQLRQGSTISTNASGDNSGGNIEIIAGNLSILEGSEISANASGLGSGGNVNISASSPTTLLLDRGKITATGGQGNITLQSPLIQLRRGSLISTNGQGTAPGGNIIIDTDFLIAVPEENSDITANAQQSFGGRVIISTQGLFGIAPREKQTPLSDITASSELGSDFSGVVQILDPNVDRTSGAVKLPSEIVDATNQIVAGCPADAGNTFVVTGRGGLPENPSQTLRGQAIWQDWRDQSGVVETLHANVSTRVQELGNGQNQGALFPPSIVEAQGWVIGNNGKVQLVARSSETTPQGGWQQPVKCVKR